LHFFLATKSVKVTLSCSPYDSDQSERSIVTFIDDGRDVQPASANQRSASPQDAIGAKTAFLLRLDNATIRLA
jgi:hypothetical protein